MASGTDWISSRNSSPSGPMGPMPGSASRTLSSQAGSFRAKAPARSGRRSRLTSASGRRERSANSRTSVDLPTWRAPRRISGFRSGFASQSLSNGNCLRSIGESVARGAPAENNRTGVYFIQISAETEVCFSTNVEMSTRSHPIFLPRAPCQPGASPPPGGPAALGAHPGSTTALLPPTRCERGALVRLGCPRNSTSHPPLLRAASRGRPTGCGRGSHLDRGLRIRLLSPGGNRRRRLRRVPRGRSDGARSGPSGASRARAGRSRARPPQGRGGGLRGLETSATHPTAGRHGAFGIRVRGGGLKSVRPVRLVEMT